MGDRLTALLCCCCWHIPIVIQKCNDRPPSTPCFYCFALFSHPSSFIVFLLGTTHHPCLLPSFSLVIFHASCLLLVCPLPTQLTPSRRNSVQESTLPVESYPLRLLLVVLIRTSLLSLNAVLYVCHWTLFVSSGGSCQFSRMPFHTALNLKKDKM